MLLRARLFLEAWEHGYRLWQAADDLSPLSVERPFVPKRSTYRLGCADLARTATALLRHPSLQRNTSGIGIFADLPSPTAFALGLGPD